MNCCRCGRFVGKDGYPDVIYDDYMGGWEEGYSYCGPCGRALGRKDKREKKLLYKEGVDNATQGRS